MLIDQTVLPRPGVIGCIDGVVAAALALVSIRHWSILAAWSLATNAIKPELFDGSCQPAMTNVEDVADIVKLEITGFVGLIAAASDSLTPNSFCLYRSAYQMAKIYP